MTEQPAASLSAAPARPFNRLVAVAALVVVAAFLVPDLVALIRAGGDSWRQGDWLINTAGGMVRRGPFGDAILWLADRSGIGPLWIVGAIQLFASLATLLGLGLAVLRLGAPDRLVLALLSPALVLFWVDDPGSAYRKELLAYLAFLPLLRPGAGLGAAWAAVALFAVAVLGHEATAFLAPMLALALWLRFEGEVPPTRLFSPILAVFALAAASVLFALAFPTVPDTAPVCARLKGYTLAPDFCDGSIWWLTAAIGHNLTVAAVNLERANPLEALAMYTACLAPVVLALAGLPLSRRERALVALGWAAVLPLFLIAVDWGRWMSMQAFGLTFLALVVSMRRGPPATLKPLVLTTGIVLCLVIGPHHVNLTQQGGLVHRLAALVSPHPTH